MQAHLTQSNHRKPLNCNGLGVFQGVARLLDGGWRAQPRTQLFSGDGWGVVAALANGIAK